VRLRGTLTVIEASPDLQFLVDGSALRTPAEEKRQLVARRTRARKRTVPPAAGKVEGVAISRSAFARRAV
jgi:hypothetical protein